MSAAQSVGTWLQYCGWKERATPLVGCRAKSQQAKMSAAQTPPGGGAVAAAAEAWGPSTTVDELTLLLQQPIVSWHTAHYMPVQGFRNCLQWRLNFLCYSAYFYITEFTVKCIWNTSVNMHLMPLIEFVTRSRLFQNESTCNLKIKVSLTIFKVSLTIFKVYKYFLRELKTRRDVIFKTLSCKLKINTVLIIICH